MAMMLCQLMMIDNDLGEMAIGTEGNPLHAPPVFITAESVLQGSSCNFHLNSGLHKRYHYEFICSSCETNVRSLCRT